MNADRPTPWVFSDERQTLVSFLDYLRHGLVAKTEGLDEVAVRQSTVPSGTSLLGLVRHCTRVEVAWLQYGFAGLDVRVPQDKVDPEESAIDVVERYREACRTGNEIVARCDDLAQRCRRAVTAPEPMSLRWVLVHLVEETARHAGHADIIREQLDGTTGR